MKKIVCTLLSALFLSTGLGLSAGAATTGTMTPYAKYVEPDQFFSGATFDLRRTDDTKGWLTRELESMKGRYNINTLSIYGLENYDDVGSNELKDHLFKELARLGMKVVVRIEAYDAAKFAFTSADLDRVMASHKAIIEYVSQAERRDQVAYFALNMPVDDGVVQQNMGGVNSETSKANQVTYAVDFVKRMREVTKGYGFTDAQLYLSVFYGWDNGFQVPSYAPAKADGYFINNYSYPEGGQLPEATASAEEILNGERLKISMETFVSQYGDAPLVVECGYHTLAYNNGVMPNQTAGLVKDLAAKQKALESIIPFYQSNYPKNIRGMLYFGYNLYKEEGNPPSVMDWSLVYPTRGAVEVANAILVGKAAMVEAGTAVQLSAAGDGLDFQQCPPVQQVRLSYQADSQATVGLYSSGKLKKTVTLPVAAAFTSYGVPISIVEGLDLELRLESGGPVRVEVVEVFETMEAEHATRFGTAAVKEDNAASSGAVAAEMSGRDNRVVFYGVRGGSKLTLTYKATQDTTFTMEAGGQKLTVSLPKTEKLSTITAAVGVAANADVAFYGATGDGFQLDSVKFTGAPKVVAAAATVTPQPLTTPVEPAPQQSESEGGKSISGGVIAAAVAGGAALIIGGVALARHFKKV